VLWRSSSPSSAIPATPTRTATLRNYTALLAVRGKREADIAAALAALRREARLVDRG
jgi:hypothetical protein